MDSSIAGMNKEHGFLYTALVYFLVFTSGSLRYNQSKEIYLVFGLLGILAVWLIYTDRKISGTFLLYSFLFAGLMFALSIYTDGSQSLAQVNSMAMKLVIAYLIVRTVGVRFTDIFVKVIVFLAAISLVGYLTDVFHLFDGLVRKLPVLAGRGYDGIFYIFRDVNHPFRNQSIFFEPGAYQGFLNAALFIIFFTKSDTEKKMQWVYIAVLLAALATAFSTTGFIIFLCSFALFFYKSEITTFSGKLILLGLGALIVSVFAAQFHSTFIKKIDDYINANEYEFTYSAQTRSSQLKADIKVIKKHIFGLGQKQYLEEFRLEGKTDNRGSSNGVTRILAMYGLPIGFFIFGSYFWAIRRLLPDPVLAAGGFAVFMLLLAGESYYISTPISYVLIAAAFVYGQETTRDELLKETA